MTHSVVQTVLGEVDIAELGLCDAHTHIWIAPQSGENASNPILQDSIILESGLEAFLQHGGSALVDCQPGLCGRDGNMLRSLSAKTGVAIIASTGFHRRCYYPTETPLWNYSSEAAAAYFLDEINHGLMETRSSDAVVFPGCIKVAIEARIKQSPLALLEGAAQAAIQSGFAIEMHTEKGADIEAALSFFIDQGLLPKRLVFCHVDKRPDVALHQEMASAGVMLEYDTFLRPKYNPEENVWPLIETMLGDGFADHIALATDMAEQSVWQSAGPKAFILNIGEHLKAMGIPEEITRKMLGGNILSRLVRSTPNGV